MKLLKKGPKPGLDTGDLDTGGVNGTALSVAAGVTAPATDDGRLMIPATSFDFLEGRFRAAAKTRLMDLAVYTAAAAVFALVVLFSLGARSEIGSLEGDLASASDAIATAQAELRELEADGTVTFDAANEHLNERLRQAEQALAREVDLERVISELSNLGGGATVTAITLGGGGEEGAAPAAGTPPPGAVSPITITGTANSISATSQVTAQLSDQARYPYLQKDDAAVADSNCSATTSCTWTWSGWLTSQSLTTRGAELRSQYPNAGGGS